MAQGFTKALPISTDPSMSANSNLVVPSQAAIVAYINNILPLTGVTSVSAVSPIASSGGPTPTISIPQATALQDGFLDTTDWNTFNSKVSSVGASSPLSSSGGVTPNISIQQATTTQNGYLSSTDWNTFNNKQNAITLTTLGTSGAATLVGSTLNIPQYTGGGGGGVSANDAIAYAIALG